MPCGLRNSFSSSIVAAPGGAWSRRGSAASRRPSHAARRRIVDERRAAPVASSRKPRIRSPSSGSCREQLRHRTSVTAHSGSSPTIERTFSRSARAVRQAQDVVEEPVLLVPHPACRRRHAPWPTAIQQEVLDELRAPCRRRPGRCERQLDGDLEHVLAEQRHPGGAVGLLEVAAGRAAARCGRRPRCCRARGSRPRRRCCRCGPCGSPTR